MRGAIVWTAMRTPPGGRSGWLLMLALLGVLLLGVEAGARPARAGTLVVTTTADSGPGSLRDAIETANSTPGLDTITFNIPGPIDHTTDTYVISPLSMLPTITDPIVIDGSTQPGYGHVPLVELRGASAGSGVSGLVVTGGGSTIRALAISRFSSYGLAITGAGNNAVEGCTLGMVVTNHPVIGNGAGGLFIDGSPNNRVGGTVSGMRNVISGNGEREIGIHGSGANGTTIQGNSIGLTSTGGSILWEPGNLVVGIDIVGASSTTIGGTTAAARNVIAGQPSARIVAANATGVLIQGNYLGTDVTGTVALANGGSGIVVDASSDVVIGGHQPGTGNVIAGSPGIDGAYHGTGIIARRGSTGVIEGNYIGLAADGLTVMPNLVGVSLTVSDDMRLGGTVAGSGNVIVGNRQSNVSVSADPDSLDPRHVVIQGNVIRANVIGTSAPVPTDALISIERADGVEIGGTDDGAGNTMDTGPDALNAPAAVAISGGHGAHILGNSILGQGGLGIDLRPSSTAGPTPNDPGDVDDGPNDLQNYPEIVTAATRGPVVNPGGLNLPFTTIAGTINSRPSTTYRVELFSGAFSTLSGRGEARTLLRAMDVTTDENGSGRFSTIMPFLPTSQGISATATGPVSGTSEVSPSISPIPANIVLPPLHFVRTTEAGGTDTFTVALATIPTEDVVVPLTSSNVLEGVITPSALIFTPANALTPQIVTVRGVDDTAIDSSQTFWIIVGPARSADPTYDGLGPFTLAASNDDDEVPGTCSPRPPVEVSTTRGGPGQLAVTVRATSNTLTSNNRLSELRFRAPAGTLIDVAGSVGRTGAFTQSLVDRPSSLTFVVRVATPGPLTLQFDVVDHCGPWPTFVGDGGR